jgi:hypothetical protein
MSFDGPRRLKRRGFTLADTQHLNHILYFGRRDLEKGRAPAARPLFAIVVDLRFDCLADVYLEDIALLRRVTFLLRKAKARSVAAGDRDLPHCHRNPSVDEFGRGRGRDQFGRRKRRDVIATVCPRVAPILFRLALDGRSRRILDLDPVSRSAAAVP